MSPPTTAELDAKIHLPTIRQPVIPLRIDDIVEAGNGEDTP
jgi:hypothetical protein